MAKQPVVVWLFYNDTWNDHTADVYRRDAIDINHAILDGQTGLAPSDASLMWRNSDGKMNPDNRKSPLYGLIGHNTPIQIEVTPDIRFTGQVVSWKPRRALGATTGGWVESTAQGTLRRLGQGTPPTLSALYRTMRRPAAGVEAAEHWSLEDGTGATQFASSVGGTPGAGIVGDSDLPEPSGRSGIVGASAAVALPSEARVRLPIRPYTDTGQWAVQGAYIVSDLDSEIDLYVYQANGYELLASVSDEFSPTGTQELVVIVIDSADNVLLASQTAFTGGNLLNEPISLMMAMVDNGGSDEFTARVLDSSGTVRAEITSTSVGYDVAAQIDASAGSPTPGNDPPGVTNIGLYTDPSFDIDVDTVSIARAAGGWASEKAGERFERIGLELGIATTVIGSVGATQPMGPQVPDTDLGLLGEIASTDAAIIHDTRESEGLTMRTGRGLNNQDATLTLNWLAGHISGPLEPDLDDAGRANIVIAKRRDGSSATATETTGRLGTAAIGPYQTDVPVNPATDDALKHHANYHKVLGTNPDPRYPRVVVDLDANPGLISTASSVDVGDLVPLESIPEDMGQASAELLVLGYAETIGSHRRKITYNTRPGGILTHVGKLDGGSGACLQTAGAQLSAAITDEQTSVQVFTSTGPLFTTSPPAGAKIVVRDREVATVGAVASALSDAFGRTVGVGWDVADSGQTWTASGTAEVSGGFGRQSLTAGATVLCSAGVSLPDVDITLGHTGISSPPVGDNVEVGARLRVSGSSYIQVRTFRQPGGTVTINVNEVVGGVQTASSGFPTVPGVVSTDAIAIRLQAFGTVLRAHAWLVGGDPPEDWHAELTAAYLAAGDVTIRGMLGSSWSGASPLTVFYDNIVIVNPQTFTLTRDPDLRMEHPAGADVRVARQSALRLTL